MELWREGYTDREIARHMKLTSMEMQTRIAKIQKDGIYGSDTAMLFEKQYDRLMKVWRTTWNKMADCDPRQIPSLLKIASDVCSRIADMSVKLGVTSPEIIVRSIHEDERKKYKNMSNAELFEAYQEQIAKWN